MIEGPHLSWAARAAALVAAVLSFAFAGAAIASLGGDHAHFGWWVFVVAAIAPVSVGIALLWMLLRRLRRTGGD